MDAVQLKDTSNDVQVVPDFSDLVEAIVDDASVETRIRRTNYEQQMATESLMEHREEENVIVRANMPTKDETERWGIYFNDSLLTPPVERLVSKLETGPSEVFRFPSPLQLEEENILTPHGENSLVNSVHSRETVERPQVPGSQTNRDRPLSVCTSTSETKMDAEPFTKQIFEQQAQAGDDRSANGTDMCNSASQRPEDKVKLTESSRLQGHARQLVFQEDTNGEYSGMNCSATANTISWEYGTSTVVSSSPCMVNSLDQPSRTREDRPGQAEHAVWTGGVWTKLSSELEICQDSTRFRTSSGPFWPTHPQSRPLQENPETFDPRIVVSKMEFSGVLKPDVKIPNRTTCCNMAEQSSLAYFSQELEKIQGSGNLESDDGGFFPPKASRPLTGNELPDFPPFSGNKAENIEGEFEFQSVERGLELTAELEFDARKQTKPAKNEGNRIEKCRTDVFAKHKHKQPSTRLPGDRKSQEKGSNEKGRDGTVVGYPSEPGSGINEQDAHELTSRKSITSRSVAWRQGHNIIERQRRHSLNNNFETLRKEIPELVQKTRAPKVLILLKARAYIDDLTKEDIHLQRVMVEEKEKSTLLSERFLKLIHLWKPDD